jgi:hypothetical protein
MWKTVGTINKDTRINKFIRLRRVTAAQSAAREIPHTDQLMYYNLTREWQGFLYPYGFGVWLGVSMGIGTDAATHEL